MLPTLVLQDKIMPATRTNWVILTLVVALLGAAWIGMTRVESAAVITASTTSPDAGHYAPDFTLQTLDGELLTLSGLRGQPVVLNFWATWCPPCRQEIPALEQVSREMRGDVIILGVDVQENADTVKGFIAEFDMTYPVVLDPSAEAAQAYRVRAYPTTYFIDDSGVIVRVFTGPLNEALLYTRLTELAGR
jgi:thiol-disulfide isomerase/thioredoxin